MMKRVHVSRNIFFDSVFLMRAAREITRQSGIRDASALMATEANIRILVAMGYLAGDLAGAGPNDLVIAVEGEEESIRAVLADPGKWLHRTAGSDGARDPLSLEEALTRSPAASIAIISVPGEHAAREARKALDRGLSVFLFSSNVSVEDEVALKTEARAKGLIVMGPDCGTAFIGGAGIGFANAVRRGPIGVVGATGTGMQELACLVHRAGSGIAHGIGTGSRDLTDRVGGISTLSAIEALDADPLTRVIVLLSKPPGAETLDKVLSALGRCRKPAVACLLGAASRPADPVSGRAQAVSPPGPAGIRFASTLDQAALLCLEALDLRPPVGSLPDLQALRALAAREIGRMAPSQRFIRGVFAGGTFCYQAQALMRDAGLPVSSNAPLQGMLALPDPDESRGHSLVDMGAEVYVEGRPHPMIDATLRSRRVMKEGQDPGVAVLLLDFILGAISSDDPVGDLLPAVKGARDAARVRGGYLSVAASICGTDADAQGLQAQQRLLEEAGALVFTSSAQAALFSREIGVMLSGA